MNEYLYKYETHLHTNWGSRCAYTSPKQVVYAAKEKGYTGIFITEHNWGGNCHIDKSIPWDLWVKYYCWGYEAAKSEGDRIGLQVFWAFEAGFNYIPGQKGTEMLVYGLTPQLMAKHPEMLQMDIETLCGFVRANGGMVVHAHPFRQASYIPQINLFPDLVDAVEAFNASHYPDRADYDPPALEYAMRNGLPITGGSDAHSVGRILGGIATAKKLECAQDYCNLIKNGGDYIITNGIDWYRKDGNCLDK